MKMMANNAFKRTRERSPLKADVMQAERGSAMITGHNVRTMEPLKTPVREKGKAMSRFRTVLMCCLLLSMLTAGCEKEAEYDTLDLGDGVTLKLTLIPSGKFMMGSPETEKGRSYAEGPQREVTLSKPFYMGIYEITQSQWKAVMGTEPWDGKTCAKSGASNAASYISWDDATKFCEALSKKTGKKVTLPTEAQWEYACRAGNKTTYSFGDDASKLGEYAWHDKNAYGTGEKYAHSVGEKKPNAFGLYDMHGNVWEWCRDWYATGFYANAKNVDPENTTEAKARVLRGGSWYYDPLFCRAAFRDWCPSDGRANNGGFRVVVVSGSGVD